MHEYIDNVSHKHAQQQINGNILDINNSKSYSVNRVLR